ncbi:unnamed protein product [marine sediment metagenome]|uniref:Uncharacterized protein n=1 Tax=marine sediment metagenome TaxID=412755 RepID=X0SNE6_9ZZZZ
MRPKEIYIDPDVVDPNGLAEAQAVSGAGEITLDGVLIVNDVFTGDYARRIGILSAGDDSGDTFTITGTDADGKSQTEDLAGSSGAPGTAESIKYYKTVTSVSTDGAAAGNVSVGTVDEFVTNTIPIETSNSSAATVSLERFSGTISVIVEETFSKLQYTDSIEFVDSPLGVTASAASSNMSLHASGVRLKCGSYTSGAELRMVINQNRAF